MWTNCHEDHNDGETACRSQCVLWRMLPANPAGSKRLQAVLENGRTNLVCLNLCFWSKALHSFSSNLCLTFTNMVLAEQKLPVQVAGLYCIHVDLHNI